LTIFCTSLLVLQIKFAYTNEPLLNILVVKEPLNVDRARRNPRQIIRHSGLDWKRSRPFWLSLNAPLAGEWFEDDQLDEHLNQHADEPAEPASELKRECLNCRTTMDVYRGVPFKVGRSDPAARLLLGWVSELGEEPIPTDLYVCPQCGRIEQFTIKVLGTC